MKRVLISCVALVFLVVSGTALAEIEGTKTTRYGWPADEGPCLEGAELIQSDEFTDGIELRAENPGDLAVASYHFEVPFYAHGLKVSLRYLAKPTGEMKIKLYVGPRNEKCNNSGSTFIVSPELGAHTFEMEAAGHVDDEGWVRVEVNVSQGIMDLDYIDFEWTRYQPRVRIVEYHRREAPPEPYYIHHYYYERVPIYVWYDYGYIVYDEWWLAPSYIRWRPTIVVHIPSYRVRYYAYRWRPSYYYDVDYPHWYSRRWDCKPVFVDCPNDPPAVRVRSRDGTGYKNSRPQTKYRSVLSSPSDMKRKRENPTRSQSSQVAEMQNQAQKSRVRATKDLVERLPEQDKGRSSSAAPARSIKESSYTKIRRESREVQSRDSSRSSQRALQSVETMFSKVDGAMNWLDTNVVKRRKDSSYRSGVSTRQKVQSSGGQVHQAPSANTTRPTTQVKRRSSTTRPAPTVQTQRRQAPSRPAPTQIKSSSSTKEEDEKRRTNSRSASSKSRR